MAKEKLLGNFIGDYAVHPQGRAWFVEGIRQLKFREADVVRTECEVYSNEGFPIWLDIILTAKRDVQGELCYISCILQDITMSKQNAFRYAKQAERAEQRARRLTASLASISHDIRTPMSAIVGFSELLCTAETEEEKEDYLSVIRNSSQQISDMLKSMLDLELLDTGQFKLELSEINLKELGRELCAVCHVVNEKEALQILFEAENSPEFTLWADAVQLRRVLNNLLSNAMKNTAAGQVRLSYEVNPDSVVFLVSDTGCGIPQEKLATIFDRHERLSSEYKGFGLGLSICRSLANAMGGEVRVTSMLGKGSVFYLSLPIVPSGRG